MKGKQKGFYRYLRSKMKYRKNLSLLLNGAQDLVGGKKKSLKYLMSSLSQSLLVKLAFRNPNPLRLAGKLSVEEDQLKEHLNKVQIHKSMGCTHKC